MSLIESFEYILEDLKAHGVNTSNITIEVPRGAFHHLRDWLSTNAEIVSDNSQQLGVDNLFAKYAFSNGTVNFVNNEKTKDALTRTIDEFNKVDRLVAVATNLALDPMINKEKLMQYRLEIMDDIIVHAGKLIGRF